MKDFGIIIACCNQDYHLAKGCCASIRHFLGDVPICLIVDGTFSTKDLEVAYGVQTINHLNVKHPVLKERSFGWGLTKMIAFWESPWSKFLVIDADTVVWGNILKFANFEEFDVIVDLPRHQDSREDVARFFINPEGVEKHFPGFQWQKRLGQYFCAGAFFAKRNIFPLKAYIDMLDFIDENPNIFLFGDQGLLNFLVFHNTDAGKIRLGQSSWQVLVPRLEWQELEKRFPVEQQGPVCSEEAGVIHWAGPKPTLYNSQIYSKPMNFFRRQCIKDTQNLTGLAAEVVLKTEDWQRDINIYQKKLVRKVNKLTGKAINYAVNY